MIKIHDIFLRAFLVAVLLNCQSSTIEPPYKEEYIVESLLLVGKGIDNFKFTRTLPVGSKYDSLKAGITDAQITITDERGQSTTLMADKNYPGNYLDSNFIVQPKTKYFLRIDYNGRSITAETTTPDTFTVFSNSDTVFTYLKDEIRFRWSSSENSAAYYFTVTNIESILIKIQRQFSEENSYARRRTRFFWTLGTGTEVFSWLHNYYGRHEIRIYAIDENFYHYLQTSFQDMQQLSEPESNLNNALGYFGSGVMHNRFYLLLPE